ncbi:MAG: hypothetical protein ACRCTJ_00390 [Brevinema sp.]
MSKENKKEQSKLMKFISIGAIVVAVLWMIADGVGATKANNNSSTVQSAD